MLAMVHFSTVLDGGHSLSSLCRDVSSSTLKICALLCTYVVPEQKMSFGTSPAREPMMFSFRAGQRQARILQAAEAGGRSHRNGTCQDAP